MSKIKINQTAEEMEAGAIKQQTTLGKLLQDKLNEDADINYVMRHPCDNPYGRGKVSAIKRVRELTGAGLKEAKDACDAMFGDWSALGPRQYDREVDAAIHRFESKYPADATMQNDHAELESLRELKRNVALLFTHDCSIDCNSVRFEFYSFNGAFELVERLMRLSDSI